MAAVTSMHEKPAVGRSTVPRRGWCHPRRVRRFAERLFSQQLWFWGRDIVHPAGNLLLEYGFTRHRPPGGRRDGSTCYRLDVDGRHIALWGFGAFYGERRLGGLYVNRHRFMPRWGMVESLALGVHSPDDLPSLDRPRSLKHWKQAHRLCRRLMVWMADYETWIRRRLGSEFRERCLSQWLDPCVAADAMTTAWRLLGSRQWERDPAAWEVSCNNLLPSPKTP
ncbi:MAG: hypothetical protein ACK5Q5_11875 [Planctomycetaceae bacterium]